MVAHRVHVSPDALGLADRAAADGLEHAQESLLADILDRLPRILPGAQLDQNQLAEVLVKMLLDFRIAGGQTFEIRPIEALKLHVESCLVVSLGD